MNGSARLNGKVALVTGAGSPDGLGDAIARRFHEEGAIVYMSDIDEAGVRARAESIGPTVLPRHQDVASPQGWDALVGEIMADRGHLDIVVNNAGIAVLKPIEDVTPEDFTRQMEVNLHSVYLGTQAAVAAMRKGQGGGSIINISSTVGLIGVAGTSPYSATKAGIRGFSRSIAIETAAEGIRVNSILPGIILTGMLAITMRDIPEQFDAVSATVPMRKLGSPADIANAALFLASDEARYVTGTEMVIDGGLTAQ